MCNCIAFFGADPSQPINWSVVLSGLETEQVHPNKNSCPKYLVCFIVSCTLLSAEITDRVYLGRSSHIFVGPGILEKENHFDIKIRGAVACLSLL